MERKFNRIIIVIAAIVIIINTFFFQLCKVSGSSMLPTFHEGNLLLMNKASDDYERMDVVVVRKNGKLLIKRLISLPGEKIKIENDKIFINENAISDIVDCHTDPGIAKNEILLGEKEYFVLGDNRENSADSRDEKIGVIKEKEIIGKVIWSIIPFRKVK